MSKQIDRLMKSNPHIFYDVSYEGNKKNSWGDPTGDGTWLYMRPSWYCSRSDCGSIHEYTIKQVVACAASVYQDKKRWIDENPGDLKEIEAINRGDYDDPAQR